MNTQIIRQRNRRQAPVDVRGFSTIEILIAFSVGIIFISAAMMIAFSDASLTKQVSLESGQTATLDTTLDNNGLYRAQNKIGDVIKAFSSNWNTLVSADSDGFFTNTPTVEDISPCMKEITSGTTWTTLNDRDRDITFGTALSDIDIARALGPGGCDPTPPGDWDNPDKLSSYDPSHVVNAGVEATSIDMKSIDGTLYAFVGSVHASDAIPDFWIFDVSDPEYPALVGTPLDINNGTKWTGSHGGESKEGINDLIVVGEYAYTLRNYKIDQLQVIDISNLNNPVQITPPISFESRGVLQTGSEPQGVVLKHYNGRLYIGLHTTIGPEFLVYDISSDPAHPSFVGAVTSSFDHTINDIAVHGNYAYVAIKPGATAVGTRELMVLNVSNSTPVDTGNGYNAQASPNDVEGGMSLYTLGNKLYLGRERVNNSLEKDFYVFDISTPQTPSVLGSKRLGLLANSQVGSVHVTGRLAFLGTTKNPEFQVWNIANPLDIKLHLCGTYDFPQQISDMAYANNMIFATVRSNDFFRIIYDDPVPGCH